MLNLLMKRQMTGYVVAILFLLVLCVAARSQEPPDAIESISPTSANQGDMNVSVTFNLVAETPPTPPTEVNPTAARLGTMTGTSVQRNNYTVTAIFNISASEPAGFKDAELDFPGPPEMGTITLTKTNAFQVLSSGGASILRVDADSTAPSPDGSTWALAYSSLIDGLAAAQYGDEIWVAEGTYYPTAGTDRNTSFELVAGVALYGGFAGNESERDERSSSTRETVLSGDIGVLGNASDNCYHVLVGVAGAALDGFTVSGGNANGFLTDEKGGGMICYDEATPALTNCLFEFNNAFEGGAIYAFNHSSATITDCTFENNVAKRGGAILNRVGSSCTITGCTFTDNNAAWRGGAVFNDYGANATVSQCEFAANTTPGHGGAIYTDDTASQLGTTSPVVSNCAFTANEAGYRGGAIRNYNGCATTVTDCAFTNNLAGTGGGAIANDINATLTLTGSNNFSGNDGGTGTDDIDTDETSRVE